MTLLRVSSFASIENQVPRRKASSEAIPRISYVCKWRVLGCSSNHGQIISPYHQLQVDEAYQNQATRGIGADRKYQTIVAIDALEHESSGRLIVHVVGRTSVYIRWLFPSRSYVNSSDHSASVLYQSPCTPEISNYFQIVYLTIKLSNFLRSYTVYNGSTQSANRPRAP